MPFDLTSSIAEVNKDAKKYSYPTGVKYPVTCLYCGKKWLVEMGATNLICSCGNQLHVLERVSRAAYTELKERVTKQIISHYDKWSGAIQAKIKADAEKKAKETEAAAKAVAAAKTSASTSGSATVTTQNDGAAGSATSKSAPEKSPESKGVKSPENNAKTGATETKGSAQASTTPVANSASSANASKKRKLSPSADDANTDAQSANNNVKRAKLDIDTESKSNTDSSKAIKLTSNDLNKKSPSPSPEGSPKSSGSAPGGANRKPSSSGRPGTQQKRHTLIVQCPKCERNVIVPHLASKVFQCPCGQYMTIQPNSVHQLGSPKPQSTTLKSGKNNASNNSNAAKKKPASPSASAKSMPNASSTSAAEVKQIKGIKTPLSADVKSNAKDAPETAK